MSDNTSNGEARELLAECQGWPGLDDSELGAKVAAYLARTQQPRTVTLQWAVDNAEPGDVLRDGNGYALVRARVHEDYAWFTNSGSGWTSHDAANVPYKWTLFIHGGTTYSIAEQAQPVADEALAVEMFDVRSDPPEQHIPGCCCTSCLAATYNPATRTKLPAAEPTARPVTHQEAREITLRAAQKAEQAEQAMYDRDAAEPTAPDYIICPCCGGKGRADDGHGDCLRCLTKGVLQVPTAPEQPSIADLSELKERVMELWQRLEMGSWTKPAASHALMNLHKADERIAEQVASIEQQLSELQRQVGELTAAGGAEQVTGPNDGKARHLLHESETVLLKCQRRFAELGLKGADSIFEDIVALRNHIAVALHPERYDPAPPQQADGSSEVGV